MLYDLPMVQGFAVEINDKMGRHVNGTREWLLRRFDSWLKGSGSNELHCRAFVLVAGPGIGKSSFCALLCTLRPEAVAAHHFCRWGDAEKASPRRMLASLAFQLAQRLPAALLVYRELAAELADQLASLSLDALFERLMLEPLMEVAARAAGSSLPDIVLLIDALDEAAGDDAGGRNELLDLICRRFNDLPAWVRFVISSRPRDERPGIAKAQRDLLTPLQRFSPFVIKVRGLLSY